MEQWISFRELEEIEVEPMVPRLMYRSLITFLFLPERVIAAFVSLLKEKPL